jgi:hypothetical protein
LFICLQNRYLLILSEQKTCKIQKIGIIICSIDLFICFLFVVMLLCIAVHLLLIGYFN